MKFRLSALVLSFAAVLHPGNACAAPPAGIAPCSTGSIEGELNAGRPFLKPIGNGLSLYFQAIQSGWILRIVPTSGALPDHDYAELATPPYNSVTPLSVSTDFAFRAQDAVGWNPRHFRFATSAAAFARLREVYGKLIAAGTAPSPALESELAQQLALTADATLTILDARLVPGTADQWRMAAAVASHFSSTAHTLVEDPGEAASPLGRLVWLHFRVQLELPSGFRASSFLRTLPRNCGNR